MAARKTKTPNPILPKKAAKKRPTKQARKAPESKAPESKAPTKKVASKNATSKNATSKMATPNAGDAKRHRIFRISFASVYPLYIEKAEKKGRTKHEVDEVIAWLTGYEGKALERAIESRVDLETFFAEAPRMNPKAALISGVVCGVRVEDLADPLMQKIRYMDKLVDELARGKNMASILRQ